MKNNQSENWMGKSYSFFSNQACEYFPCHKAGNPDQFNCLFCYCPLYMFGDHCGGNFAYTKHGVKDCSNCLIPHEKKSYGKITEKFIELSKKQRETSMKRTTINIKKTDDRAIVPSYGSEYSAGADLYACLDGEITIEPGETVMIPTGIAIEIPDGYTGLVCARSGLATKKGLAPANKVGVIDSDYRGEIMVALYNHAKTSAAISPGERIAQLLITPVIAASFTIQDDLSSTHRGSGGFGSTGRK